MGIDAVMEARRVLGYAALGLLISGPVAANAREGLREAGDLPQARNAFLALEALNRGFMPDAVMCREGQRELNAMAHVMIDRGEYRPGFRG